MIGRILFANSDRTVFDRANSTLRASGFDVSFCEQSCQAFDASDAGDVEVVVAGPELPDAHALCQRISSHRPDTRVILLGLSADYEAVLAALRAGAFDYFVVPVDLELLEPAIHRATTHRELREELRRVRTALSEASGFEELIGASPPMAQLYELLEQAAPSNASVLVTGESGTGKELVARALHKRSPRCDGPFVAVNCSALPENLLESELFGHVRGAFTDAKVARSGLFVKANGGTVFLDEIADMPRALQPKLLRALQERTVRPVGGDSEVAFDIRLVAATNQNLEVSVAEKQFREDLFYRINVIHIDVPPLRERATDVLLLAQHFVEHFALVSEKDIRGFSPQASEKVLSYPWPGNVRELQNCMERAVALTRQGEVTLNDLPEKVRKYRRSHVLVISEDPSDLVPMEEVERRYVSRVLQAVSGNKREAARILGFDRKTLYRKLERFGIKVDKC